MLMSTTHYSEGIRNSSGVTSRNLTRDNVYSFRIIYIMLTKIIVSNIILTNNNRYLKVNINCHKLVNK